MNYNEVIELIGKEVDVEENDSTFDFRGRVTSVHDNEVDGVYLTIVDKEDNYYDISEEFISKIEN